MTDFFDKIKKQVEKQTLPTLNIRISRPRNVQFVEENKPESDEPRIPAPVWIKKDYTFDRGIGFPITPDTFRNYYGSVEKSRHSTEDGGVHDRNLDQYCNIKYSIKIYCKNSVNFVLNYECEAGNLYISTTPENEDESIWVSSESQATKGNFRIYLTSGKWITFQILYYSSESNPWFYLGPGLKEHITSWSYTDTEPPAVPTWASPTIETSLLDPDTGAAKITLYWNKNTEDDFAGNGIYRRSVQSTGASVGNNTDPLLLNNSFYCGGSVWGTILCGASIQIVGVGTTYIVKAVDYRPPNLKANGDFENSWTGWDKSATPAPTLVYNNYVLRDRTVALITDATNQLCNIQTTDYVAVATNDYYRVFYQSSFNFVPNEGFEFGTINEVPRGWTGVVSDSSIGTVILATVGAIFGDNLCKIVKGGIHSYAKSDYFKLKNGQNIVFSCYASTNQGGARLAIDKQLNGSWSSKKVIYIDTCGSFTENIGTWKADGTGTFWIGLGYQFDVGTNSNQVWYDQISCHPTFGSISARLKVNYYDSGYSACATAYEYFALATQNLWQRNSVIISRSSETGPDRFPKDCSYIKFSFDLENLSTTTEACARLLMDGIYFKKGIEIKPFTPTTNGASFVQVNDKLPSGLSGSGINQVVYEHIQARAVEPTDTGIISWDDINVQNGITYGYVIDAYDTEFNKSNYSAEASIVAGDTTPPATIHGLTGEAGWKLVALRWTNPTASDFQGVKVYVDGTQEADLRTKEFGLPEEKDSVVVGALAEDTAYDFYLTTFDKNKNENRDAFPSINVTTNSDPYVSGGVYITTDRDYYGVGTFDLHIYTEFPVSSPDDITVTVKDVDDHDLWVNNLTKVGTGPTVHCAGSFNITNTDTEGDAYITASGADMEGYNFSGNKAFTIDYTAPVITEFLINDGDAFTDITAVRLRITASGDPYEMRFRNIGDGSELWSPWVKYGDTYSWNIPDTLGIATVEVQIRDQALNVSSVDEDDIELIESAPLGGKIWLGDDDRRHFCVGTFKFFYVNHEAIFSTINDFHVSMTDGDGGDITVSNLHFWGASPTRNVLGSFNITNTTPEDYANILVTGTVSDGRKVYVEDSFLVDRTAPSIGTFTINDGDALTTSLAVELTIGATGDPDRMAFSNDNSNWSPWENYAVRHDWNLSRRVGEKTVYAKVRDLALNESSVANDTIIYVSSEPPDIQAIWLSIGGDRIFPNEFNWFNQVIVATLEWSHKVSGNVVASVACRRKYGSDAWTSWVVTATSDFTATVLNYDGNIQFECWAKDVAGNKSETKNYVLFEDKIKPIINESGLWSDNCKSRMKGAFLEWNPDNLTDALSGMAYTEVWRAHGGGANIGTLIVKLPHGSGFYADYDYSLEPFETYYYRLRAEDKAENLSNWSSWKGILIYPNWKEEFANWLDNSSFERIGYDGHPESWATVGSPSTISPGYYGNIAIRCGRLFYYQTEYTYLPAYDVSRNFIISAYVKRYTGDSPMDVVVYVRFYDTEDQFLSGESIKRTIGTVSDTWKRCSDLMIADWIPSNAAHCKIAIRTSSVTDELDIDCIQWEEKDSLPASDYVDTRAISGDRVMAHFIRGDMIEAETIRSTEISAYAINATHLSANSVVVEGGKLEQIRVGAVDDYHTLLINNGLIFKKGAHEFGYVRRMHHISDIVANGSIKKFEDYGIASFQSIPGIFLFPEKVQMYKPDWSSKNQFIGYDASDVTATHFKPMVQLYGGVAETKVVTASGTDIQCPFVTERPDVNEGWPGYFGSYEGSGTYDAMYYQTGASVNQKVRMKVGIHFISPHGETGGATPVDLKIHFMIGTFKGTPNCLAGTFHSISSYTYRWYRSNFPPTGTYYVYDNQWLSGGIRNDIDVVIEWESNNCPGTWIDWMKLTKVQYYLTGSIEDLTDARVGALVMET